MCDEEKVYKDKGFVVSWTKDEVVCQMVCETFRREFKREPFFKGMKLFKGKNVWFETNIVPSTMITKCVESKKWKVIQLWNYHILHIY